ncbi:hypothetical protein HK097_011134, partial [Rhizophlyctis rosea]
MLSDSDLSISSDTDLFHAILSWSEDDLRLRFKDVVTLLRDRERDLTTAAEIGQHLLETNQALEAAYDNLLAQLPP